MPNLTHSSDDTPQGDSMDVCRQIRKSVANNKSNPHRASRSFSLDREGQSQIKYEQNLARQGEGRRHPDRRAPNNEPETTSLRRVLDHTLSISGLLLAVLMSLFLYLIYTYPAMAETLNISMIPYPFHRDICQQSPIADQDPSQYLHNGLAYGSKLEEIQKLSADSVDLPLYLRIGERGVRSMIIELSAADEPSR